MKRIICGLLVLVLIGVCVSPSVVEASYIKKDEVTLPETTEVAKYAFEWADHTEIPYVWGGGRGANSLEELAAAGNGTDCSGFTSLVYRHFGYNVTMYSGAQKSEAKQVFTDITKAVPGDIVWWSGHVAIYIGDEKIVHTNTSRGPYNYPHVSSVYYRSAAPTFLRMVDDVSELKPLKGTEAEETKEDVKEAELTGSVVTESDITGMPIESTLEDEAKGLPMVVPLNQRDSSNLEELKTRMTEERPGWISVCLRLVSFVGIFLILYGVLFFVAYLFDRVNMLFEFSLLGMISFGRCRYWDDLDGAVPKHKDSDGKTYLNFRKTLIRFFVFEFSGLFLVSGWIFRVIFYIITSIGGLF